MGVGKNWKNLEKNLLTSGISPFTARVRLNLTEISMHAKYRSPINPLFLTISRVIGSLLSPSSMEYLKKKKRKKRGKKNNNNNKKKQKDARSVCKGSCLCGDCVVVGYYQGLSVYRRERGRRWTEGGEEEEEEGQERG